MTLPGITPVFDQPFFNECTLRIDDPMRRDALGRTLLDAGIIAGVSLAPWYPELASHSVWCATEMISQADIDKLFSVMSDQ